MEKRIGYLLKRVQLAFRAAMDRALSEKELTAPQYAVLSALERAPGISNAELARRSFVTPQTMIRIVDHLEELQLIERKPLATHRKVLSAELTPAGARLVASCHQAVDAVEAHMLRNLDAREQATLQALLERCADASNT